MDATTNTATIAAESLPAATSTATNTEVKSKPKGKVAKLKLVTKGFRPGIQAASSVVADVYSIVFGIPVTSPIGSGDEIGQAHKFAVDLNALAEAESVGVVEKIGIANGTAEIMLKLGLPRDFPGEPTDEHKDKLVSEAFQKLNDFLAAAPVLKGEGGRHRASWKVRINGSVIDDGVF